MQIWHLSDEQLDIVQPVALAYRRAYRAGAHQTAAVGAAMEEYRRLNPSAPADDLPCSAIVIPIIAAAINVDTDWFWKGSDA
jgi:hypothetical protein